MLTANFQGAARYREIEEMSRKENFIRGTILLVGTSIFFSEYSWRVPSRIFAPLVPVFSDDGSLSDVVMFLSVFMTAFAVIFCDCFRGN